MVGKNAGTMKVSVQEINTIFVTFEGKGYSQISCGKTFANSSFVTDNRNFMFNSLHSFLGNAGACICCFLLEITFKNLDYPWF
jgi:hypothetical protein